MTSLVQIWNFTVSASEWTAIAPQVDGNCLKLWFAFTGDLHLRSDPNNAETDYLLSFADGNQFNVPVIAVAMSAGQAIVYAQAASSTVNVTLFCIIQ